MAKNYVFMTDEELEKKNIELDETSIADVYYMLCRGDFNKALGVEVRDTLTDFIESIHDGFALIDIESELKEKGLIVEE